MTTHVASIPTTPLIDTGANAARDRAHRVHAKEGDCCDVESTGRRDAPRQSRGHGETAEGVAQRDRVRRHVP
jgi:hypothetical protein